MLTTAQTGNAYEKRPQPRVRARPSTESWKVAFRERASRACLQVAFELACRLGVPEFDRDNDVPRPIAGGVLVLPRIVPIEPRRNGKYSDSDSLRRE